MADTVGEQSPSLHAAKKNRDAFEVGTDRWAVRSCLTAASCFTPTEGGPALYQNTSRQSLFPKSR
jgi:hypothetical protein